MRIVVTGQIGLDKKQFLEETAAIARAQGESLQIYHIGDMMYREAPDVPPGRILDLPLARLNSLRRAVFRDILSEAPQHRHVLINTHATFRWKHGLFAAFDFDQLAAFGADLYVCLVDNIETVHARMLRDHATEHSLKDLMVWREEEILATEILAKANTLRGDTGTPPPLKFLVLSRGRGPGSTAETLFRLIFRPAMKMVYPSFPMTHIFDLPDTLAEVNTFRARLAEKFITFDPGDVDEKLLADQALNAAREGRLSIEVPSVDPPPGGERRKSKSAPTLPLKVADVLSILPDIDGQIYARDFLLVRQSDMIVSYIPEIPSPTGGPGKPGLSSGVERELQHAHDHGRESYVIWKPAKDPSPFITQTANRVFRSIEEAFAFFEEKGYLRQHSLFGP
ncbi:MAG TPA: AAA family ATPase [Phycisphaerae bacterium]|nr:AAA family ATPase [Phycisphaerae bacterium]